MMMVVMVVVVVNDLLLLSSVTIEIPCLYINNNVFLYCQFLVRCCKASIPMSFE
jgi:hypothetical protein